MMGFEIKGSFTDSTESIVDIRKRYEQEIDLIANVIVSAIYLGGIAIIQTYVLPLFGESDVPARTHLFLFIGDLILLTSFLIRLIRTLDQLWRTLIKTKMWQDASKAISKIRELIASENQK